MERTTRRRTGALAASAALIASLTLVALAVTTIAAQPISRGGGALCRSEVATILGTDGADVIVALGSADTIRSIQGADIVCAGAGNDRVHGGKGPDELEGGNAADALAGGKGRDRPDTTFRCGVDTK
jgi:Ca2+-binding RTX toxin-like protein